MFDEGAAGEPYELEEVAAGDPYELDEEAGAATLGVWWTGADA